MQARDLKPVPEEQRRAYRSLLRDLRRTLLSEIGARAVYDHIARRARDPELARLATELNQEGVDLVAAVQDLFEAEYGGSGKVRLDHRKR